MTRRQERPRWLTDPHGVRFAFDSGAAALDFAYTGGPGRAAVFEVLHTPADLVDWLAGSDLAVAVAAPTVAVLDRILALRPAILDLATAVATGAAPTDGAVSTVNRWASRPPLVPRLTDGARTWTAPTAVAAAATLARDTVELATAGDGRLRQCAAADCPLLFHDTSRSGGRRWCSMQRCGNRQKVRRHRDRDTAGRPGAQ